MTKVFRVFSMAILSAVLAAGCAARGVRIAELKDQPGQVRAQDGQRGRRRDRSTVPDSSDCVPFQGYTVDDGTGEITVLARSSRVPPRTGARVRVKGQVNELGVFGGRSIGLHLQEDDRKIKN